MTKEQAKALQKQIDLNRCKQGRCGGCQYCPKES